MQWRGKKLCTRGGTLAKGRGSATTSEKLIRFTPSNINQLQINSDDRFISWHPKDDFLNNEGSVRGPTITPISSLLINLTGH
jgi:hypothetical protein